MGVRALDLGYAREEDIDLLSILDGSVDFSEDLGFAGIERGLFLGKLAKLDGRDGLQGLREHVAGSRHDDGNYQCARSRLHFRLGHVVWKEM